MLLKLELYIALCTSLPHRAPTYNFSSNSQRQGLVVPAFTERDYPGSNILVWYRIRSVVPGGQAWSLSDQQLHAGSHVRSDTER